MFLKSMFLGSTRFFFAPADKPDAATDNNDTNDDAGSEDTNEDNDEGDGAEDSADGDEGDGEGSDGDDDTSDDEDGDDGEGEPGAGATRAEKADWRDKQLAKQHRKIQEGIRRQTELEAENETLRAIAEGRDPKAVVPPKKPVATDPDPVRTAKEQIRNEDAQAQYDKDCNKVFADGVKRYPKSFEKMIARIPMMGEIDVPTMQFLLATDDPVEALYKMASDPDEYERIMDLPLAKRATALAKIGIPPKTERKTPSGAPNPVVPLNRNNSGTKKRINPADPSSDKAADEEWFAAREAQRAARFAKKNGR